MLLVQVERSFRVGKLTCYEPEKIFLMLQYHTVEYIPLCSLTQPMQFSGFWYSNPPRICTECR